MNRDSRPLEIAFWAMVLAIGLPVCVFMFGALRDRQLQSTANPRWAQFAKVTSPKASRKSALSGDSRRRPIRTASILSEDVRTHEGGQAAERTDEGIRGMVNRPETNLTGSVSGRSSIELPVHSEPIPSTGAKVRSRLSLREVEDHPSIASRPLNDVHDAISQSTLRLESQMMELRQRLDQLVHQNRERQSEEFQRETQILEALRRFNEMTSTEKKAAVESEVPGALSERDGPIDIAVDNPIPEEPAVVPMPLLEREEDVFQGQSDSQALPEDGKNSGKPEASPSKEPTESVHQRVKDDPILNPSSDAHEPAMPVPDATTRESPRFSEPKIDAHSPADSVNQRASSIAILNPTLTRIEPGCAGPVRRDGDRDSFSVDVRDADIREFLGKLSEVSRVSILPSPNITGRISLALYDVRFETILKAIGRTRGYLFASVDDVVMISTPEEVAKLANQKLEVKTICVPLSRRKCGFKQNAVSVPSTLNRNNFRN